MRKDRSIVLARPRAWARGFTLAELLVVIAIIAVILAIALPSFSTISRDLEVSRAKSDVQAALAAARTRAIRDRRMVALHIFRDGPAYAADSTSFRWGAALDPVTGWPQSGIPHLPTHKMVMRLEIANPCTDHLRYNNPNNAVEFIYLSDHEPVVLSDALAVCRPDTELDRYVDTEAATRVQQYEDFYIVFDSDGKLVTVLVDCNLADLANTGSNTVTSHVNTSGGPIQTLATWSSPGLCLYDPEKSKALATDADRYAYVNRSDNTVMLSPYTGLPMTAEAIK